MTFGPRIDGDSVVFRLWAPSVDNVEVEIRDQGRFALAAGENGWKETRIACGAGARYRFWIGDMTVPDPASRQQDGGVHGWSVVLLPQPPRQMWPGRPWQETVLYECHPGLMGGFQGIAQKLEGLAALGITAIELMPIAAFPGSRNWGYDGVLPFAPAECYGSVDDLVSLIDRAHELRLMVFLDVVYNHFGPDGNYLPVYAKPFFRTDTPTPWGAAIDFRSADVRAFYDENIHYWLFEIGFDGLRFDAVHAIADDGWLDRAAAEARRQAGARRIHLVLENDDNIASHLRPGPALPRFDAQWNDDIHHALHVLLTGETDGYYQDFQSPAEKLARGLREGFIYQGDVSANRHGEKRGEPSADLPPTAFVAFLQNHDQIGNRGWGERLTTLADPKALKAAVALQLLMPQIPLIYMGEEIGSRSPFLYFTDHGPELAKAVREGRRREFAGFKANAGGQEVPDPNAPETFEQSRPERDAPDRAEWLDLYRRLLQLRHENIIPFLAGAKALAARAVNERAVLAQWELAASRRLTIGINLGNDSVQVDAPDADPFWGALEDGKLAPCTTVAWLET